MCNILVIAVLLMPWIIMPFNGMADGTRLPREIFFDLISMSIICFSIIRGLKFNYKNKYLGWLSIWVFITIFFNWYLPSAFTFNQMQVFNIWTLPQSIHFILGLVMVFCMLCYLEEIDYLYISKFICFSAVLVTLFATLQIIGFDPLKNLVKYKEYEHHHFSALVDHPNMVGNLLAISLPFFFINIKEHKYKIGAAIVLAGVFLSHSSVSIIAATVSMIIYLVLRIRTMRVFSLCSALLILFAIFCFTTGSFNKLSGGFTGRLPVWKMAIEHIKDNPIFGQGLAIFKQWKVNSGDMNWTVIHNDWLELSCALGFLGVFLFLCVIFNTFKNFNYVKNNTIGISYLCSFIAFIMLMFGSFPIETPTSILIGLISFCGTEKLG